MRRRRILKWMVASIPQMESELHFFVTALWFFIVFPKFMNFCTFSKELTSSMILPWIPLSRHEHKCMLPIACHRLLQLPDSGQCQDRLLENCTSSTWKQSYIRTCSVGLSVVPSEVRVYTYLWMLLSGNIVFLTISWRGRIYYSDPIIIARFI